MVNVETLSIKIPVNVSNLGDLSDLADELRDVAEAAAGVPEKINVDVSELSDEVAELEALNRELDALPARQKTRVDIDDDGDLSDLDPADVSRGAGDEGIVTRIDDMVAHVDTAVFPGLSDGDVGVGATPTPGVGGGDEEGGGFLDTEDSIFTEDEALGVLDFAAPFTQDLGIRSRGGGAEEAVTGGGQDVDSLSADLSDLSRNLGTVGDLFGQRLDTSEVIDQDALLGELDARDIRPFQLAMPDGPDIDDLDLDMDDILDTKSMRRRITGRGSLGSLLDTLGNFNLRMESFHNALADLIPILLVFIGALPAAIAGLAALTTAAVGAAAALAAVGGLAGIGFLLTQPGPAMENLQSLWEDVKQDFLDSFEPLARDLAPLFRDAVGGLDRLFEALAARGGVLRMFTDDLRALGGFILEHLPDALAALGRFSHALMGVFSEFGEWLTSVEWVRSFTEILNSALPAILATVDAFLGMLPAIIQLSQGFLNFVAVLMKALEGFSQLMRVLPVSAEFLGMLTAGFLVATTALSTLASLMSVWPVVTVGKVLAGIAAAILGVESLTGAVYGLIASLTALQAALVATGLGALLVGAGWAIGALLNDIQSTFSRDINVRGQGRGGGTGGFDYGGGTTIIQAPNAVEGKRISRSNDFEKRMSDAAITSR